MAETDVQRTARSLIACHGSDALRLAERAASNVRTIGMTDKLAFWEAVAAAIRSIQAGFTS